MGAGCAGVGSRAVNVPDGANAPLIKAWIEVRICKEEVENARDVLNIARLKKERAVHRCREAVDAYNAVFLRGA